MIDAMPLSSARCRRPPATSASPRLRASSLSSSSSSSHDVEVNAIITAPTPTPTMVHRACARPYTSVTRLLVVMVASLFLALLAHAPSPVSAAATRCVGVGDWPTTLVDKDAVVPCLAPAKGTRSRKCTSKGTWAAFEDESKCEQPDHCTDAVKQSCTAQHREVCNPGSTTCGTCVRPYVETNGSCVKTYDGCKADGAWPSTLKGRTASLPCKAPLRGTRTRACSSAKTWGSVRDDTCTAIEVCLPAVMTNCRAKHRFPCVIRTQSDACKGCIGGYEEKNGQCVRTVNVCLASADGVWPATNAGMRASVECAPPLEGQRTRQCSASKVWSAPDTTGCHPAEVCTVPVQQGCLVKHRVMCVSGSTTCGDCLALYDENPTTKVCVRRVLRCAANAGYPPTMAGQHAQLACYPPAIGWRTRTCTLAGNWLRENMDDCFIEPCSDAVKANCATLHRNPCRVGSHECGSCIAPAYDDVDGECLPAYNGCRADGDWPKTPVDTTASLKCHAPATAGDRTRKCLVSKVWGQVNENKCTFPELCDRDAITLCLKANKDSCVFGSAKCGGCKKGYIARNGICVIDSGECLGDGVYPTTFPHDSGERPCPAGQIGYITRECIGDGVWSTVEDDSLCVTPTDCKAGMHGFGRTKPGRTAYKNCPWPTIGRVSRKCLPNGQWDADIDKTRCDPCNSTVKQTCIDQDKESCTFGHSYCGACLPGYVGSNPSDPFNNVCTKLLTNCPATGGAQGWPETPMQTTATVPCVPPLVGTRSRHCGTNKQWAATVDESECQPKVFCDSFNGCPSTTSRMSNAASIQCLDARNAPVCAVEVCCVDPCTTAVIDDCRRQHRGACDPFSDTCGACERGYREVNGVCVLPACDSKRLEECNVVHNRHPCTGTNVNCGVCFDLYHEATPGDETCVLRKAPPPTDECLADPSKCKPPIEVTDSDYFLIEYGHVSQHDIHRALLNKAVIRDTVYPVVVLASPARLMAMASVSYWLDDPSTTLSSAPVCTVTSYPFAFQQDDVVGMFTRFGAHALANGPHTLTVKITTTSGESHTVTAHFRVDNRERCKADDGFPDTHAGEVAGRECPDPLRGEYLRVCSKLGEWEPFIDMCWRKGHPIQPVDVPHCGRRGDFDPVPIGHTAHTECPDGYTHGRVSRVCLPPPHYKELNLAETSPHLNIGVWSRVVSHDCRVDSWFASDCCRGPSSLTSSMMILDTTGRVNSEARFSEIRAAFAQSLSDYVEAAHQYATDQIEQREHDAKTNGGGGGGGGVSAMAHDNVDDDAAATSAPSVAVSTRTLRITKVSKVRDEHSLSWFPTDKDSTRAALEAAAVVAAADTNVGDTKLPTRLPNIRKSGLTALEVEFTMSVDVGVPVAMFLSSLADHTLLQQHVRTSLPHIHVADRAMSPVLYAHKQNVPDNVDDVNVSSATVANTNSDGGDGAVGLVVALVGAALACVALTWICLALFAQAGEVSWAALCPQLGLRGKHSARMPNKSLGQELMSASDRELDVVDARDADGNPVTVRRLDDRALVLLEREQKGNYEAAARSVKEQMDRKFGPSWHCVIGEGFGFHCTYETSHMIYLFYQGNVGILLFKC